MAIDKLTPTDSRVQHCTANLNGRTYHYLLGKPQGEPQATIFLIHGWPDLSFGWRYQIPVLLDLGLRVVAPDMMGYGGTDAPKAPPASLAVYSYKSAADDLAELARQLDAPQIILGGHDWGGAIAYRVALWYPQLITALFSVCTPYFPPAKSYYPLEQLVKSVLPNFTYQLQLAGPDVESAIQSPAQVKQFLSAVYGARGANGETGFTTLEGVQIANLPLLKHTPLLSEDELDYYARQYSQHADRPLHGPLNWYRTRELNFKDEEVLAARGEHKMEVPCLFVLATKDGALPPSMSANMDKSFVDLTRGEVEASHWALWEKPLEVNELIRKFLTKQLARRNASL